MQRYAIFLLFLLVGCTAALAQPVSEVTQDSLLTPRDSLPSAQDSLPLLRNSLPAADSTLTFGDSTLMFGDSALMLGDSMLMLGDSTLMLGDSALLAGRPLKKKERRIELPKMVDNADVEVDTTHKSRVLRYRVNHTTNEVRRVELDSSLFYFRTDYPFFRDDVGAIFLGSLGSPVMPYSYAKRAGKSEFIFMQPYETYFFSPDNVSFYNTTTPYTLLYYDWAGSKSRMEDQLRVLHAQSITHTLNFGVAYNGMGTKGVYPRQRIDNRSFSLSASYLGKYYKANLGYIFNEVEAQESGGITDDKLITDTVIDPLFHLVNLQTGKNHLRNNTFFLTHSVDIPMIYIGNDSVINNILMGRIGHSLEYSSFNKVYSDNNEDYYANRYMSNITRDSLGLSVLNNRMFVQFRPLRAYIFESLSAGVGYKNLQTFMFYPAMYFTGTSSERLNTFYAYASMSAWYKKYFRWNAYAQTNLAGYQSGGFELKGDLTLSVYPIRDGLHLNLGALLARRAQDVFIGSYFTNHYSWSNTFDHNRELRLEASLLIPMLRCEVGVNQSIQDNFIYFGRNAIPQQHPGTLSISALTLNHQLEFKGINIHHRMIMQLSSDESVVSVPLFAVNATYYYERDLVKNVLRMQLGVDLQYCTLFNGYEYNPSVGMYHTSPVQLGGHLWADAFVAFRWKRTTPFIKWEHVLQGLIEGNTRYFSAVHYPRNERVFKFGLSWKFFD
jgi:hypothetical protein